MDTVRVRRWARKPAIVVGTFVVALATVAAALYFGRAPIAGGGSTEIIVGKWESFSTASGVTTTMPTVGTNGTAQLPTSSLKFYPGTSYSFTGKVMTAKGKAAVAGIELPGLPAGYTATIKSGCGSVVGEYLADAKPVTVEITAGANATAGSWTLRPEAALLLAPTSVTTQTDPSVTCAAYSAQ